MVAPKQRIGAAATSRRALVIISGATIAKRVDAGVACNSSTFVNLKVLKFSLLMKSKGQGFSFKLNAASTTRLIIKKALV